ncbi:hypothetical protein Cadr_000014225 [Camelus dromedarius]|uniref:Uncharacterized protein n=1 Tax=Camelus dromedarius TaxID=9838 RepID=A0A5N4DD95_CAMDR|nr:hypothetical protein Cadr_000014225 [Camelus dromedarius]
MTATHRLTAWWNLNFPVLKPFGVSWRNVLQAACLDALGRGRGAGNSAASSSGSPGPRTSTQNVQQSTQDCWCGIRAIYRAGGD